MSLLALSVAHRTKLLVLTLFSASAFGLGCGAPADDSDVGASESHFDSTSTTELVVGEVAVPVALDAPTTFHGFRFAAESGSSVVVSVRSIDNLSKPTVRLLDDKLAQIASGTNVVRADVTSTATYYVDVVHPAGATTPALTIAVSAFVPIAQTADEGTTWEFPRSGTESWRALHASASNDVWAAGAGAVIHWDGAAVHRFRLADDAHLSKIWARGSSDVWVGGDDLFHFDGAKWSRVIRPASKVDGLGGSGANDIWLAADPKSGSRQIRRWNGERWSDAQDTLSSPPWLLAVGTANDAWLFGGVSNSPYHFDGTSWTSETPAETFFTSDWWARDAVVFSDGGLAVIFGDTTQGDVRTHDTTGKWTGISSFTGRWPLGLPYQGSDLQSIWGTSPKKLWVTSQGSRDVFRRVENNNEQWEAGGEWRNVPSEVTDAFVRGAPDGTAWFAGARGQLGKQDGPDLVKAVTEPGPRCASLSRAPTGEIWAACEGALRKKVGAHDWKNVAIAGTGWKNPVVALWAETAKRVFYATSYGELGKVEDDVVTKLGTFTGSRFVSISGSSQNDVWFSCDAAVVRWNGSTLTPVGLPQGAATPVGDVRVSAANDVFISAGNDVVHFDGLAWHSTFGSSTKHAKYIVGSSPTNVWLATETDLDRWSGSSWDSVTWQGGSLPGACQKDQLEALAAFGSDGVVLTTSNGCVGTYTPASGFAWVKRPVRLNAIAVDSPSTLAGAVTSGGIVTLTK